MKLAINISDDKSLLFQKVHTLTDREVKVLTNILSDMKVKLNPSGIEIGDCISFDYTKNGMISSREGEVEDVFYCKGGLYITHINCKMQDGKFKKFIVDKISNLRLL